MPIDSGCSLAIVAPAGVEMGREAERRDAPKVTCDQEGEVAGIGRGRDRETAADQTRDKDGSRLTHEADGSGSEATTSG